MSLLHHDKGKKLKQDGTAWEVVAEVEVSGQMLYVGFSLWECADGWYQVYNAQSVKHYFRVSEITINEIQSKLKAI